MKKYSSILFFVFFLQLFVQAQQEVKAIRHASSPYEYWLAIPEGYDKKDTTQWPLIIFLHGRSLSGHDLQKVRQYGLIHEIDKGRKFPAFIIAPQVNKGESWNPTKVIQVLKEVEEMYHIDTTRISITGMSLGGYGTLHTAGEYPDYFCAVAAFCGGGKPKDACNLSTVPVWIAHGKKDRAVPYGESYEMVERIKKCKGEKIKFTSFESYGHGELERMFRTEELVDFLLKNQKGKPAYFPEFKKTKL